MFRRVAGSFTSLVSDTGTIAIVANDVIRTEVSGSDVTGKLNGATTLGPATDTNIIGHVRAGVTQSYRNSQNFSRSDSFEAGDLAAPSAISIVRKGRLPFRGSWRGSFRMG